MKTPILGGAYTARSVNAAANRCVNLFPESIPEGGKEPAFLSKCPGLRLLNTIGTGPIRGLYKFNGLGYVVSGFELYSITTSYTATLIGAISGSGPVSMADNGTQMFIAANPDGYILTGTTLAQITDEDFPGASKVGFLNGYFVFIQPNTQMFWTTALYDGYDIDALDFASAEGSPDKLVSMAIDHNELWLFGERSVEVWYDSGGSDFPFTRISGAFVETGCDARNSVAKLDNSLFWLGSDERGNGTILRATGYNGARISTHAIEHAISGYGDTSNAVGFSYQQEGHTFYCLSFSEATWCYDVSTGLWHERAGFDNGEFTRHRANCQMTFNNETIVGDFENGKIYALDMDYHSDDDEVQKWLRAWRAIPPGQNNLKRATHHSLQFDCESGIGLDGGGSNPVVNLRWSDDGGHTWSNYHSKEMGQIGEFGMRVIWRRLGMTEKLRDRVYEVSGSDSVPVSIMGAELIGTPNNH